MCKVIRLKVVNESGDLCRSWCMGRRGDPCANLGGGGSDPRGNLTLEGGMGHKRCRCSAVLHHNRRKQWKQSKPFGTG